MIVWICSAKSVTLTCGLEILYSLHNSVAPSKRNYCLASNQTLLKLCSVLGVTMIVFLVDWFYLIYVTLHGLEPRIQPIPLESTSLSLPLQWLPVLGILLLSLVLWYEEFLRIFPKRGAQQSDPLQNLRLLRVITLSLAMFVVVLYIPNVMGSNWFWGVISKVSQMHFLASSVLQTEDWLVTLSPLWQYSMSQVLASTAMVLSAWVLGGPARRSPRR